MAVEHQILRVTYEAFSKFSNSLLRCRTYDALVKSFRVNLKYLFNFHVFRASYNRGDVYIHLQITASSAHITVEKQPGYLPFEEKLLADGVPKCWTNLPELNLQDESYVLPADECGELWGWVIKNDEQRHIVVSVLAGKSQKFTRKDITFLKLVAENLEAKLFEICLLQELDNNNKQLEQAIQVINEKNNVISTIIESQQQVISDRTQEIAVKNEKLLEVSVLNAHSVREPLSRVLGLVNLLGIKQWSLEDINKDIMPRLKISAQDLDLALKQVIEISTTGLVDLNKKEG